VHDQVCNKAVTAWFRSITVLHTPSLACNAYIYHCT